MVGQGPAPFLEGPLAGDRQGAAFVGGGNEPDQQLAAGGVRGREPASSQMIRSLGSRISRGPWARLAHCPGPRTEASASFTAMALIIALTTWAHPVRVYSQRCAAMRRLHVIAIHDLGDVGTLASSAFEGIRHAANPGPWPGEASTQARPSSPDGSACGIRSPPR